MVYLVLRELFGKGMFFSGFDERKSVMVSWGFGR